MTHRDNFLAMMSRRPYDSVPLDLPMTPPVVDEMERRMGTRSEADAFNLPFSYIGTGIKDDGPAWREAYERLGILVPDGAWVGSGGQTERPGDQASVGNAYHLTEMFHPLGCLESLDQIRALPWRDLDNPAMYAPICGNVERIHSRGRVAVMGLECSVFENAWYLRGMEQIYSDLAEENGIADWLFDRYMTQSQRLASAAAQAGADLIRFGDDVGTQRGMMMSVPFWRKHFKPRLQTIVQAAKAVPNPPYVQYHSDGNITDIVDDLIEIGIDILNPVQPECMPIDEVAPGGWIAWHSAA